MRSTSTSLMYPVLPGLKTQDLKFQGVIRSVGGDLFTPVWTSGADAFSTEERRPYSRNGRSTRRPERSGFLLLHS